MRSVMTFGILCFLALFIVSRVITTGALKRLSDEDRHRMYDEFLGSNNGYLIFLVILVVAYFAGIEYFPAFANVITLGYMAVFSVYLITKFFINLKKLRAIDAPAAYLRSYVAGYLVFIVGFVVFGATVAVSMN